MTKHNPPSASPVPGLSNHTCGDRWRTDLRIDIFQFLFDVSKVRSPVSILMYTVWVKIILTKIQLKENQGIVLRQPPQPI